MAKPQLSGGKFRLRRTAAGVRFALLTMGAAVVTPPVGGAVGDYYIGLAGQSNMVNMRSTAYRYPLGDPNALEFVSVAAGYKRIGKHYVTGEGVPNTWNAGTSYVHGYPAGGYTAPITDSGGGVGDGVVYFGNLIAEGLGGKCRLIHKPVSGSSIKQWLLTTTDPLGLDNGTTGAFSTFRQKVIDAGGKLHMVIWLQGEADSGMSPVTYRILLGKLHAQFKALSHDPDNFIFGIISLGAAAVGSSYVPTGNEFGNIRLVHVDYGSNTPGAFYVGAAHDTGLGDGAVHIDAEGFNRIWRRFTKTVLAQLGIKNTGKGGAGNGPKISTVTRDGRVVTVNVTHAGGTALMDGLESNGTALTSFRLTDSSGDLLPVSTAILGSTIQLTVGRDFTGTVTLDHARWGTPCHTTPSVYNPAGEVYDNDGYYQGPGLPNTNIGSPLQPWSGIVNGG